MVTIAAMAVAVLVATAAPAAAKTVSIEGAKGVFNANTYDVTVYDTLCDDDSVYVDWESLTDNGKIRNNQGCGTSLTAPTAGGPTTWRVCVDRSWPTSDRCSAWIQDG